MRGRGSGIEIDGEVVYVGTARDGRTASWRMYVTLDEALAAVGAS